MGDEAIDGGSKSIVSQYIFTGSCDGHALPQICVADIQRRDRHSEEHDMRWRRFFHGWSTRGFIHAEESNKEPE